MPTRNTAYYVAAVRQITNTENDPIISDPEIIDRCSEAKASLYDLIIGTYEHYAVKKMDPFTLVGGVGHNTVTLPSDFYKDVGLTLNPLTTPVTVHRYSSYVDRNNLPRRQYICIDNYLEVSPPQIAAGIYQLAYTPLDLPFAAPIVVTPHAGDAVDAFGNWTFANGAFDSTYVGATCTIVCGAFSAIAGSFVVATVAGPTVVHMTPVPSGAPVAFGTAATNSFQLAGTVDAISQIMVPWYEYIQVHAAVAVKNKIEQDATELMQRLAALTARIEKMAANRMEEGGQIALPRQDGGFWGNTNIPGGT